MLKLRKAVSIYNYKVLKLQRAVNVQNGGGVAVNVYNYKCLKLQRAVNVQNGGGVESSECF